MKISELDRHAPIILDNDIVHAMKKIPGYLDITPEDFMEVYQMAFKHAFERLKSAITAEHVMTKEVITVDEYMSLVDTAKLMASHNISGCPVLNAQNKMSGVLSEKDFLKNMNTSKQGSFMHVTLQCLGSGSGSGKRCAAHMLEGLSVKDIMSSPPIFVEMSTPILEVANVFEVNNVNRVPVLDKNSNLAGIIARSDLVKALS